MATIRSGVLGEDADAIDGRVYLESISELAPAQDSPDITFSNLGTTCVSDIDRTNVQCDIANHDKNE